MSQDFITLNEFLESVSDKQFSRDEYEWSVAYLEDYNELFRRNKKQADEWASKLSPRIRKDLGRLFKAVKYLTLEHIYESSPSISGDSARDAAVTLALRWPSSLTAIVNPKTNFREWADEVYPSIEHVEEITVKSKSKNQAADLEAKLHLLNSRTAKIKSDPPLTVQPV